MQHARKQQQKQKPQDQQQEVWKPCPGFTTTHEVSNLGRLRSIDRICKTSRGPRRMNGKVLAIDYTHQQDYAGLQLSVNGVKKRKTVHSLVARAFHGAPPGPVGSRSGEYTVDHVDGDKTNNCADNLEWVTSDENRRRAIERGTIPRGATHPRSKLTEDDVRHMRELYESGEHTQTALAEQFGISPSQVSVIIRRKAWKHVP